MHVIYSYVLCIAKEWPDIDFFSTRACPEQDLCHIRLYIYIYITSKIEVRIDALRTDLFNRGIYVKNQSTIQYM